MTLPRRLYKAAATLVLCALAAGPAAAQAPVTVRLGSFQTAIDYAPYLIAKEKGWIDEALRGAGAVAVYLPTFQSLPSTNEALAARRVDVVLNGEIPTIVARAAGIDVQIAWMSCRLQAETIVPLSSDAKSVADLKGRRVAVLAGSAPYYWFVRNLRDLGLSKSDVTFLDMTPPDARAAFGSGAVDAWAMFPPWPEQELAAGTARALPGFKAPIQVVATVRTEFADQHPAALAAVLAAFDKAKAWLREHPAEAQEAVSRQIGLALPVVRLSWSRLDWAASFDTTQTQPAADFLVQEGFVKNEIDAARMLRLLTARK